MAHVRILGHSANAWRPNLVFKRLFSKRKKSIELKCCREVMVDNCCKSRVALRGIIREVMTFFLISTTSGYITRFSEIVARRDDLQIMPWLVCREI